MAPGESAQFSASARFADGSARDITSEVAWISSDEAVLSVAPGGHARSPSTIPDALRRRRYTAMLTQDANARVQLRLSGADFEVKYFPHGIGEGNLIHGQASDGHVRLVLEDVWDWGVNPNLIERLGDDTYLIIAGEAVLRQTGSGLSGVLNGYFRVTRNAFAGFSTAETCVSTGHGFTLSK